MNEALYGQVKGKLNITWEDEDTTARINDIINSAIPDLLHRLGITDKDFDFSAAGVENTLFLAYCFYEWNHVLNEFEDNYANVIARTRQKHEVAHYLESEGEGSE
jgi:hypothetical protein